MGIRDKRPTGAAALMMRANLELTCIPTAIGRIPAVVVDKLRAVESDESEYRDASIVLQTAYKYSAGNKL